MTITEEELARLAALSRAASTSELGAAARDAVPALVAEVRECRDHARRQGKRLGEAWQAHDGVCAERDALRAENERLREALHTARLNGPCNCTNCPALARERDTALAEAAELRASLADAVGRMGRMEKVVEAARGWYSGDCEDPIGALTTAVDAYEASLPGIEKVEP